MAVKGWIEVSDTYCKGCELCLSACPQSVMELNMSHLTPKGYVVGQDQRTGEGVRRRRGENDRDRAGLTGLECDALAAVVAVKIARL